MSLEMIVLWVAAIALIVIAVSARVPKKIVRLWTLCFLILFFWVSCTDRIVYDRGAKLIGQKVKFNRPMAYTKNLNKHMQNEKSYKLNRALQPLEKTDQIWFHSYNGGVKELNYVPSYMTFTVEELYENVPGWLIRGFSGITRLYVLKDEEGKLSDIWDGYVDDGGSPLDKEFMKEVAFLDKMAQSNSKCSLTVILYENTVDGGDLDSISNNLKKALSFYNAAMVSQADDKHIATITGDVDAMAFVYSSRFELRIKSIIDNSCVDSHKSGVEPASNTLSPTSNVVR